MSEPSSKEPKYQPGNGEAEQDLLAPGALRQAFQTEASMSTSATTGAVSELEMAFAEESSLSEEEPGEPSKQSETDAMTREELKAHLEANEERVGRMTDRVERRLDALDEKMDARLQQMEEREEKFYSRIESTLSDFRAERQSEIGDLREEIGEMRGDFQSVKAVAEANFRNRRIMVGVIIAAIAIVQILVALYI